ncbi:hypothetical protein MDIS_01705 [Mesomycoplasma dispar]|nr:hypothetical protein MDIS_01705 [Mesomycoplasma dispar]
MFQDFSRKGRRPNEPIENPPNAKSDSANARFLDFSHLFFFFFSGAIVSHFFSFILSKVKIFVLRKS